MTASTSLSRTRRVLLLTTALIVGLTGVVVTGSGDATAARRSVVVLGDSFSANSPDLSGCSTGPTAWPKRVAARTGMRLLDGSCSGAVLRNSSGGYSMGDEAAVVARTPGAFSASTGAVLIQLGMNDKWGSSTTGLNFITACATTGCSPNSPHFRTLNGRTYAAALRPMVDYVRYHATKAKIAIVGYPQMLSGTAGAACLDVLGLPLTLPQARGVRTFLHKLQTAARDAAAQLGVEFIDLQGVTAGHGLCTAEPFVNGIANPRADFGGIPLHPSTRGDAVAASTIARAIRS